MVSDIYINGVKMPEPLSEGVSITKTKLWSGNRGSTASGLLVGTVIGIRTTVRIQWGILNQQEAAAIEAAAMVSQSVSMTYTDVNGQTVTQDFVFDAPVFTWMDWEHGLYSGCTLSGESRRVTP